MLAAGGSKNASYPLASTELWLPPPRPGNPQYTCFNGQCIFDPIKGDKPLRSCMISCGTTFACVQSLGLCVVNPYVPPSSPWSLLFYPQHRAWACACQRVRASLFSLGHPPTLSTMPRCVLCELVRNSLIDLLFLSFVCVRARLVKLCACATDISKAMYVATCQHPSCSQLAQSS